MHIKDRMIFLQIKDYVKSFLRPYNLICTPIVVEKPEGKRILVLSPHFDDDVIGCGGTLYKHILSGDEVTVIYFTDGREGDPDNPDKDLVEAVRKEEARRATEILGIKNLIFLDEPETQLKVNEKLLGTLAGIFTEFKPDLVYLPSFIENHIDHLELNRIFFQLVKRLNMEFHVCAYEAWTPIPPNIIVDIGEVIEKKEQALKEHKSQIRQVDYVNATLGLNRYRSAMNLKGGSYAEAFFCVTCKDYVNLMEELGLEKRLFAKDIRKEKNIKEVIKKIPILGDLAKSVNQRFFLRSSPESRQDWEERLRSFPGSKQYWEQRYAAGGHSGPGSFNRLAEFKADVLNQFVYGKGVKSVIEYGCGDGNQLRLYSFPNYLGFDVSSSAVSLCKEIFHNDNTKTFKLIDDYNGERAELTISIDVLYHLIEDDIFELYMKRLFKSSDRYVVIYSSNTDKNEVVQALHVRNRKFTRWIKKNLHGWKLIQHIPNKYPFKGNWSEGSFADFYIYEKG